MRRPPASRLAACLVVLAAVVGLLSAPSPAVGQTEADRDRIDQRIDLLRQRVLEASGEESRLLRLMDASSARERSLAAKVSELDGRMAVANADLTSAAARLREAEAEERAAERRLADAGRRLDESREALARQALMAYLGEGEANNFAGLLLTSSSLGEAAVRRSYVSAVVGTQQDAIVAATHVRDEVSDLQEQLDARRRRAQEVRTDIAARRDRLAADRAEQDGLRRRVAEEVAERGRLRDQVMARRHAYEVEVDNLEKESAAITEILRRRPPVQGPRPGRLLAPLQGAQIVSGFGTRVHPIYGTRRMHTGVDFAAGTGTPIRAAGGGTVVSSGSYGGYGIATIVDHGGGLATLYAHQTSTAVRSGQRVEGGQVIGKVGSTGASTGPHLHFEVRSGGDPVNPAAYL